LSDFLRPAFSDSFSIDGLLLKVSSVTAGVSWQLRLFVRLNLRLDIGGCDLFALRSELKGRNWNGCLELADLNFEFPDTFDFAGSATLSKGG
jgi:hypothetical protein